MSKDMYKNNKCREVEFAAADKMLAECRLCPRLCGVNRSAGERGVCGQTAAVKAARAALHMWEEPCISGKRGSGAVFFCGCALHCVFCQNQNIANANTGKEISIERLSEIFLELQEKGANNINLVTPGHYVPQIIQALEQAKMQGLKLPIVYNTSSYETVETIRMLEGYVDVYLPDLKYMDEHLSGKYSHAPDYFLRASATISEMVRQTGSPRFVPEELLHSEHSGSLDTDWQTAERMTTEQYQEYSEQTNGDGILVRGTVVRHLLLPGAIEDAKRIVKYLLDTYGSSIYISLMNQYTPMAQLADSEAYRELARKVTEEEYEELLDYAIELGIENGFIQEGETAEESFIPEFDGEGLECVQRCD